MDDWVALMGGSLPFLFFPYGTFLYFQIRSEPDEPRFDPCLLEPFPRKERSQLLRIYATLPQERLRQLYGEPGLRQEARFLVLQELLRRKGLEVELEYAVAVFLPPDQE